ncbi:MAG: type II toxin-antitoxin system MqsA family antitoxin [Chloroflexi bacterium]|nr:type II toxin-antitoxin system MqsA family antitoxin [Chloroflexota bacterium]
MTKCVVCRNGEMTPGSTIVTLARDSLTLVVKDVPALVCDNCGEEYVEDSITARLLETAEEALKAGVQVDVRYYAAA